jgi:undecaprenyl-diphosphatase
MSTLHAIVLGIVQGLSEFLPISSSGHLALVQWLFGWDDFGGDETLETSFSVAVHLGTLLAVITYYRRDLVDIVGAGVGEVIRRQRPLSDNGRLAWLLVLSAIPAALIGSTFNDTFEQLDDRIGLIAVMLIVFGLVLLWADRRNGTRVATQWNVRDALAMGLGQALALQPGVSRSGVTMTVGLGLRYRRDEAARLAFLMSIPVIAGAGVFQGLELVDAGGIPDGFHGAFFWGFVSSALTGWAAIWLTLRIVRSATFLPFAIYRVVLGSLVLVLLATGFR